MQRIDKEMTRVMAMQRFGLRRMPAAAKENEIYADSIALVLKTDGKEYYVVMAPDPRGNNVVKADFEPNYGIVKVLEVRPVVHFKPVISGTKPLDKAKNEDMVDYLKDMRANMQYHMIPDDAKLASMKREELYDLCVRVLRRQNSYIFAVDGKVSENIG